MDWLGVRKFANACMCPKSLNFLIESFSSEYKIEYSKPQFSGSNASITADINFGKVAESVIQYHASGAGKSGKESRTKEIRNWIFELEDLFFDDDDLEYIDLDSTSPPWLREEQWWIRNVKFSEEDVNDIDNNFEQWVRQFNRFNFDELDWEYEQKIYLNRPLPNGKYLPISGVMDLICRENRTIIELKTTASWKKDIAKLQVMIYGDLLFRKEKIRPMCFVFHDNLLSACDFEYINNEIEKDNEDEVKPSIQSCRDCLVPRNICIERIEVPNS